MQTEQNGTKESASLHGEVLSELRRLILEGELEPGTHIVERMLCERLKVSRTPLREAFKVLASEGLLDLLPNRGARVSQLREADLRDAFEVIGAMESLAGELAATRATDDVIAEIRATHYQMYAHYLRRELPEYFRLNQAIHRRIIESAGNSVLLAQYDFLTMRVARARYFANRWDQERWAEAMREHDAILDALTRRSAADLSRLLREHLMHKLERLSLQLHTPEHAQAIDAQPDEAKPVAQAVAVD